MNTAHFKQKLEEELAQVEAELKTVGVQDATGDWEAKETAMDVMSAAADPNEAADKQEEYQQNRSINNTLEVRYNNILRALKKIEEGTYGVCEVSGETIEEDRLEANPAARTSKAHMDEEDKLPA